MVKTKWIIEPNKLTIYPKRVLRLMGLILFIVIGGISFYIHTQQPSYDVQLGLLFYGLLLIVPLILILKGETNIVFDGNSRTLYNKISGITIGSIPFDNIAAAESYQIIGSGFDYRIFKKSNRHGKGLIISAAYSKASDLNLQAFEQEVLPKIDELVFANAVAPLKQKVFDFEFFRENGGVYTVRYNKAGALIGGIIMIGITVAILLNPGFIPDDYGFRKPLYTYFPMVLGLAFVSTFFNGISFDKHRKKVITSAFAGRIVKEYDFDNIIRFQIVRTSTNLIYTGTEVRAQIDSKKNNRVRELVLRKFKSTKKIERFLDETYTIMGRI